MVSYRVSDCVYQLYASLNKVSGCNSSQYTRTLSGCERVKRQCERAIVMATTPHPNKGQVALSDWGKPRVRCQVNGAFQTTVRLQVLLFSNSSSFVFVQRQHLEQNVNILDETAPHPSLIHLFFS